MNCNPTDLGIEQCKHSNLQLFSESIGNSVQQRSCRLLRAHNNKLDTEIITKQKTFSQHTDTHHTAKKPRFFTLLSTQQ